jgi:dTMP kinase
VGRHGGRRGRFEAAALDFHRRVREAYLAIARREPGRVVVIDAARNPEQIFEDTWRVLQARIPS